MNKIIFLVAIICFAFPIKHIAETHDNGMPSVIKEYSTNYSKLSLSKETGYYADGTKKYERKYYNGKLKSSYKWDRDGKKIISNTIWSEDEISEFMEGCTAGASKGYCQCVMDLLQKEFPGGITEIEKNIDAATNFVLNAAEVCNKELEF